MEKILDICSYLDNNNYTTKNNKKLTLRSKIMIVSLLISGLLLVGLNGMPEVGDPAPTFEASATSGVTIKLSDLKGSWLEKLINRN